MTNYFIFFMPKGVSAHPIAIYSDKKKAIKHMHDHGNEYTELRQCSWDEGVLPRWADCTKVEVPSKKEKKKKQNEDIVFHRGPGVDDKLAEMMEKEMSRDMTSEEKKLTHDYVLSKFEKNENKEANSNLEKQKR